MRAACQRHEVEKGGGYVEGCLSVLWLGILSGAGCARGCGSLALGTEVRKTH